MDIFCADIGSVKNGNFGWYAYHSNTSFSEGTDIVEFAELITKSINKGYQVSLGFEAPLFTPFREDPNSLTQKRSGETNPNWIGGPGSAVLATGLAQIPWILNKVKEGLLFDARVTLNWDEFAENHIELYIWEAFVSGNAKGDSHIEDARIAVEEFKKSMEVGASFRVSALNEPSVMSLVGACLLRTGWSEDLALLAQPCLVIKP